MYARKIQRGDGMIRELSQSTTANKANIPITVRRRNGNILEVVGWIKTLEQFK